MGAQQESFLITDAEQAQRRVRSCNAEYWRLRDHHPEQFRKNLIEAHLAKAAAARGIDVAATGRDYAQRLEAVSVEIRSSGNGEAV